VSRPDSLPVVVIACKVFQALLEQHLPDDLAEQVTFMDYGLHQSPSKLTSALQEAIDSFEEPSLVVLGYGLCGNGLHGIKAGRHTLLVPRADDCIAVLLGSREAYRREFESVPGTYYLTKGWLESGSNPLQEYETYVEKYGSEKAQWIMDLQYQNYERLVLVAHSQAELETYRPQAQEIARYCERWGIRYEEILGSDVYVRRLIEVAAAPDIADRSFVIVPPDGELRMDQFVGQ
jgi:hypothetical protein